MNGEEGEVVVGGLGLLANHPGQAASGSLCSDPGFLRRRSPRSKPMFQEQASDPTLRLKPKEGKATADAPTR